MSEPHKHILVAVMGKTPQIITETLYALMRQKPRVSITDIYIITTSEGARAAWTALSGPQGAIARLCMEYGVDPAGIRFEKENIKTICREDGTELDDIRGSGDNVLLASQLFGVIRELTEKIRSTLYCSIAGGRKTMSSFMMLALTLYGRKQDRLSHVLVSEEVENSQEFYFPTRRNDFIVGRRGNKQIVFNAKDAVVELADIPFIRLREFLGPQFEKLESSIEELIGIAQEQVDLIQMAGEKLVIDLAKKRAMYGNATIPVSGKLLALLAYYADRKLTHCTERSLPICGTCRACFQKAVDIDRPRFVELFSALKTRTYEQFNVDNSLSSNVLMTDHNKLNKKLEALMTASQSSDPALRVGSDKLYGETRYGLLLDKNRIEIVGLPTAKK
ncbi:MAG TPA: CRISPR-associated ring nuclease Csm6 [Blastocatellia bacterium]|nr:CRISPR-associated ring nuclease Csm6 [Blastocatellia bacterium]